MAGRCRSPPQAPSGVVQVAWRPMNKQSLIDMRIEKPTDDDAKVMISVLDLDDPAQDRPPFRTAGPELSLPEARAV